MATGPEGSAYEEDGKRYRAALAKVGVEVQLLPTAGSVDTATLVRDPRSGVSVGLMQGGGVGAAIKLCDDHPDNKIIDPGRDRVLEGIDVRAGNAANDSCAVPSSLRGLGREDVEYLILDELEISSPIIMSCRTNDRSPLLTHFLKLIDEFDQWTETDVSAI